MHIRQQGSSLALIRITYDAERKRGVQSTIARIPTTVSALDRVPAEVLAQMTPGEHDQLRDFLTARAEGQRFEKQKTALATVALFMRSAAEALDAGVEIKDPAAVWDAMTTLQKSLRKAGHAKPTRATASDAKETA